MSDKTKNKRSKRGVVCAVVIAVLLILGGIFVMRVSDGNILGLISDLSGALLGEENRIEFGAVNDSRDGTDVFVQPEITLYLPEARVAEPEKITAQSLKSADNSYGTEGGAKAMYDGDPSTCTDSENEWSVLDAGENKSLGYIKYLPNTESQALANTCVGTRFLASEDNKNFVELGTIMPDVNSDLTPDWHIMDFSGYGEYRYFKVETPPNASLSEVEWISYDGINADKNGNTTIDLTAYDVQNNYSGLVTVAVYNRDKMLKAIKTVDADFIIGEYTPIEITGLKVELGDRIRIIAYDKATMTELAKEPLEYRNTNASSNLWMSDVYSDNMMFQADEELVLRGKAPCGSVVTAEITNNETGELVRGSTTAQGVSDWKISFDSFQSGGNYDLKITAEDEKIEFKNVTFGDVWVFAGQSNMEFCLSAEDSGAELLKSRDGKKQVTDPNIRLINMYRIGINGSWGPADDLPLSSWNEYWAELNPDSATYLSAVSYYFAKGLREKTGRNIGIISVAVGDTEINKWYPRGEGNGEFLSTDGRLYNNRIYPFTGLKVKGILWYQGEADQYRTGMNFEQYSDAMAGLIDTYREKWGKPDLPFYYAQVTRYGAKDESEIREGQRIALGKAAEPKNLGMIPLTDIYGRYEQDTGCARGDIHPWQKELVAERFLNYALNDVYGESCDVTGPVYESSEIIGNRVYISFRHKGSLKVMDKSRYADSVCDEKIAETGADTSVPQEFWVTDASGKLYAAKARIEGGRVVAWNDSVEVPTGAVYAWGAYPEMPNLTDDTGLPVSTFDTRN